MLLLGSGELGKELVIAAQKWGLTVCAVDRYANAPAMQVADEYRVIDMLDGKALEKVVMEFKPDLIVPEIEAIRTEKLLQLEDQGYQVIPSARAVHLTMNRDAIRDLAAKKLKLKTAKYLYASSLEELLIASEKIGFPNVVKPVMSSSGKGQSVVRSKNDVKKSWKFAVEGMRGDKQKVIIEEFIPFISEITLLTVRQKNSKTLFVQPIGHRQERGDYQESWMPAKINKSQLLKAQKMAKKITDRLGGYGLYGVEFFLTQDDVYFSELSPRPHDTGLVTLFSQSLSEFDLHLRAILGIPIKKISYSGPTASAVILAQANVRPKRSFEICHWQKILGIDSDVRIFGKPEVRSYRRMGVVLTRGKTVVAARLKAKKLAAKIKMSQ